MSDYVGTECMLHPISSTNHLALFAPKGVGNCSEHPESRANVVTLDHYWARVLDKKQVGP